MSEHRDGWQDWLRRIDESQDASKPPKITEFAHLVKAAEGARKRFMQIAERIGGQEPQERNDLQTKKYGEVVWFRGERHWPPGRRLQPKVYRKGIYPPATPGPRDAEATKRSPEKFMLSHFQLQAISRHRDCPAPDQEARWMCLAQHWGLPTRLLDWTGSILTAAWFATHGDVQRRNAYIWALAPAILNWGMVKDGPLFAIEGEYAGVLVHAAFEGQTVAHTILADRGYTDADRLRYGQELAGVEACHEKTRLTEKDEKLIEDRVDSLVLAVAAPEVDPRMMMQQAGFTIHTSDADLKRDKRFKAARIRFKVKGSARKRIAEQLRDVGVHRATVYPDLGNLAADIEETWKQKVK